MPLQLRFFNYLRHKTKYVRQILFGYIILIVALAMVFQALEIGSNGGTQSKYQHRDNEKYHLRSKVSKKHDPIEYFFDKLTWTGIRLIGLETKTNETANVSTYGIFEEDSEIFRKVLRSGVNRWEFVEITGKDYRLMRPTRKESKHAEVITHYFLLSSTILHVAVVFPRKNFLWIAGLEITDPTYEYLANVSIGIPLPMAVDKFKCNFESIHPRSTYKFCVPRDWDQYEWQLQHAHFHECHFDDIVFEFKDQFNLTELFDWTRHQTAVREVTGIAKSIRMPIVLFGGSLLGWYRQCNQIVESADIDMAVLSHEYKPEFFHRLFKSKTMTLRARHGTPEYGLEYRAYTEDGVALYLDVFLLNPTTNPEKYFNILWSEEGIFSFTDPRRKGVCSAELFDTLVFIPCDYEETVVKEFGSDGWFEPKDGYPYITVKKVRDYVRGEDEFLKHLFDDHDCSTPDPMWGCESIPDDLVQSDFYRQYKKNSSKFYLITGF